MSILAKVSKVFQPKPAKAPVKEPPYEEKFTAIVKQLLMTPYKTMYCLDQNGDVVLYFTNNLTDRVTPDEAQSQFLDKHPGLILIHNHPNSDTPPSINDLTMAAKHRASNCIVVSPDYVYNIYPGEHGWAPFAVTDYLVDKYFHLFKITGYKYEKGEKFFVMESTETALAAIIHDLGYGYTKSRITLCPRTG